MERVQNRVALALRVAAILAAAIGLACGACVVALAPQMPAVLALRHTNPLSTSLMRSRQPNANRGSKQIWIPYDQLPRALLLAVVAGEDLRFFQHDGLDRAAIWRAVWENSRQERFAMGGSTITQQLAKNLFLTEGRSPFRKAIEVPLAVEIDAVLTKERILEIYLNVIEWGDGVYGCGQAAAHHFGKEVTALTESEALMLAAIIPMGRKCDPLSRCAHFAAQRTRRIQAILSNPALRPILTR